MSFNDLSRRELQSLCKEYGLPANKTNTAMASSLTTFLGDPRTNVLARAPQQFLAPAVAKTSNRAKVKIETQETSLAALILGAKPREVDSQVNIEKKGRDMPGRRSIKADLSAVVTAPANIEADCMIPKTTPLLRRRRNREAIPAAGAESIVSCPDFARVMKQSIREPQLVPDLNAAALDTSNEDLSGSNTLHEHDIAGSCPGVQVEGVTQITSSECEFRPVESSSARDQGSETRKCCQNYVQPALSHVFRVAADVDKLINRATAMLEKFQEWKCDLPQGPETDIAVGS